MLVLSRRTCERIIIETSDGPIVVEVIATQSRCVRLGIDAPRHVTIRREELDQRDTAA